MRELSIATLSAWVAGSLDLGAWGRWFSIVVIDLTLAGDNAVVIALAVRSLPAPQQLWGRLVGSAGAVVLRLVFIMLAGLLLRVPVLQALAGIALFAIGARLVRGETGAARPAHEGTTLAQAVGIIMAADLIMSLDNVLAVAAAAGGDYVMAFLGIALSLPFVVWGSGILSRLMAAHVWVVWLGGGILGYIAAGLLLGDPVVQPVVGGLSGTPWPVALSAAAGLVMAVLGWAHGRRPDRGGAPSKARARGDSA